MSLWLGIDQVGGGGTPRQLGSGFSSATTEYFSKSSSVSQSSGGLRGAHLGAVPDPPAPDELPPPSCCIEAVVLRWCYGTMDLRALRWARVLLTLRMVRVRRRPEHPGWCRAMVLVDVGRVISQFGAVNNTGTTNSVIWADLSLPSKTTGRAHDAEGTISAFCPCSGRQGCIHRRRDDRHDGETHCLPPPAAVQMYRGGRCFVICRAGRYSDPRRSPMGHYGL